MGSVLPPVQITPSQGVDSAYAFINQNFQNLANALNPLVINDGTNNRILLGKDNTGAQVLKISKPGFDVFSTGNANLIFNSNQNTLKIITSGSTTQTIPNTGGTINSGSTFNWTVNFTNTTGKVPVVIAYFQMNQAVLVGSFPFITGNIQGLPYTSLDAANVAVASVFFDISTTSITFYFNQGVTTTYSPAPVITFYYTVLQESIN